MSRESLDYYAEYQRLVKRQTDQMKQMQEMERELKKYVSSDFEKD